MIFHVNAVDVNNAELSTTIDIKIDLEDFKAKYFKEKLDVLFLMTWGCPVNVVSEKDIEKLEEWDGGEGEE